MIKTKSFAAAALLAVSSFAVATPVFANGSSRAEQRPTQTANAGDRKICIRDSSTGSRLRRLTCKTEREWIAEDGSVPGRS